MLITMKRFWIVLWLGWQLLCLAPLHAATISHCVAPARLTVPASDADGGYTVSWAASPTAGATYVLEEATNPIFTAGRRVVASLAGLSRVIDGRTQGVTYYYRVRAVKAGANDSPWLYGPRGCAVASGTPVACAAPGQPVVPVSDADGGYTVSWTASPTAGVLYLLQEATNPAFTTGRRLLYAANNLSKVISGRAQGTTYYYQVRAIKPGAKDSGWSTGPAGCAVPGTDIAATPGPLTVPESDLDGGFSVSWGPSATPGAGYVLEEATDPGFTAHRRLVYAGPAPSKAISGRTMGITYYYRVKAVRPGCQDSPWLTANGCRIGTPSYPGVCPLNDTGITWYGNGSQNFLASPPPGFEGQDADYGRDPLAVDGVLLKEGGGSAGFDFTKLDAGGHDLPAAATAWGCVRDNYTGLVWEVKSAGGGLRDWGWRYSWYNSDPASNGGAVGSLDPSSGGCGGTLAHCNTEAYVTAVNQAGLCGANDWRLPRTEELHSLVDFGRISPDIDTTYFPRTYAGRFWSSSPYANDSNYAWVVDFGFGYVDRSYRNYYNSVRLVRGGQ